MKKSLFILHSVCYAVTKAVHSSKKFFIIFMKTWNGDAFMKRHYYCASCLKSEKVLHQAISFYKLKKN